MLKLSLRLICCSVEDDSPQSFWTDNHLPSGILSHRYAQNKRKKNFLLREALKHARPQETEFSSTTFECMFDLQKCVGP